MRSLLRAEVRLVVFATIWEAPVVNDTEPRVDDLYIYSNSLLHAYVNYLAQPIAQMISLLHYLHAALVIFILIRLIMNSISLMQNDTIQSCKQIFE